MTGRRKRGTEVGESARIEGVAPLEVISHVDCLVNGKHEDLRCSVQLQISWSVPDYGQGSVYAISQRMRLELLRTVSEIAKHQLVSLNGEDMYRLH